MFIGGLFHAVSTLLEKIDHVQNRFLSQLGISSQHALLEYNFPPPSLRRNIAVLGLLQKRVLGQCHASFEKLLPWWTDNFPEGRAGRHNKQLHGHWGEIRAHPALFRRSIFGQIDVYNNLPQHVVDATSVSMFQNYLTHIAKTRCKQGEDAWASSFCSRSGDFEFN